MNREILFRVWDNLIKDWLYFHIPVGYSVFTRPEIDWKTLGQWTGIRDKNKKRIFDGDLYFDGNKKLTVVEYKFFLENGDAGYYLMFVNQMEIVGNVHQNKDLLK